MTAGKTFRKLSACEAADIITDGALVGFSGFTPAGAAKAVPRALAARAQAMHNRRERYRIRVLTGASTGVALDDALAEVNAISWRAPYQSSAALRKRINRQETEFVDMHLSHLPQMVEFGFFGNIDVAVVEAVDLHSKGRVDLNVHARGIGGSSIDDVSIDVYIRVGIARRIRAAALRGSDHEGR